MSKLKIGVIGLGEFGEIHCGVLSSLPHVDLVAVCTRREKRAREVAKKFHVNTYYTDYRGLLKDSDVEAVVIAASNNVHKEMTIEAAKNGKHILVEKPFVESMEDADEVIKIVNESGIHCMVGHVLKFDTRYAMVKERVEKGELGEIEALYARRNTFEIAIERVMAPAIEDAGIHDLDIMLWLVNDDVDRVYSEAENPRNRPYPNIMATVLRFKKGAIGILETFCNLPYKPLSSKKEWSSARFPFPVVDAQMEVIGSLGSAFIDLSDHSLTFHGEGGVETPDTVYWPMMHDHIVGSLREELAYFARCILEGKHFEFNTLEEARKSLEVALAGVKSSIVKKPVALPLT